MKYMIILAAFICNQAFSQQTQKTDSLKNIISKNSSIDEVHKAYCKLIDIELDNDIEYAETLINELFNYGKSNKCVKCDNSAYFFLGHLYERKFKINESLNSFEFSAKNALKIEDFKQFHDSYMWKIQILLSYKTNTDSIEKEFIRYEKIADSIQLNYGKQDFYFLKAYNYYNQGYLNFSLDFYKKAEKYLIDNKIENFTLQTSILNNTAQIFKELKDKDKTNHYLKKALELARKEKDSLAIMNIILHMGVIETDFKNFKKAIPNLQQAYQFFNRINHDFFKASSALYLSIAYYNLKNYDEAMKYNNIAELLYENSPSQINLGEVIAYKVLILLENNQNNSSIESLIEKLDTIFKNNEDNPSYLIALKAKILYKLNNNMPKEAFLVMQRKDSLENILQEKFNRNLLNELEIKYQTDKKEQEINLLKVENELAKKQKYLYIGLLLLVIFVGFSLFQLYRNKIKTAEKIKELNEFKSRFFANISHEFRTPLTLIKSPIQSLKSKINEEEQQKQLALVDQNANRMLELVDQLLELSKLDSNVIKLKLEDGNVLELVSTLTEPFAYQALEKKIKFSIQIEKSELIHQYDRDVMQKIITNLLINALKYTPEDSSIDVFSTVEHNQFIFKISNNGVQIKKEELNRLFERFYQKAESHEGVGIGLALVKELVELHQGQINALLENEKLTFEVRFNLSPGNTSNVIKNVNESFQIEESDFTNELPVLLIVDDNEDIRQLIKNLFSNEFKVFEATDGIEGINIAQKEIPDCIISDVMMPRMDGFTFTQKIKSDELTSFIPVVLLTAKNTDEAHLEGLKSTTDTFMTKPFNNDILIANVKQLISERIKLHQRFSQELILKPVDIKINSVDEKFIQKIQIILETHLSKPDFSTDEFSKQIGMSRMQLHRKLKSLFGVTTSEFIRNERLKIAADLLKRDNSSIADIAYSVGFNDVSYFSKCFKDHFGMSPSEFK